MELLNNVLLLHQPLDFVVEVFVSFVEVAFQHLDSQHVELYELGYVVYEGIIFSLATVLDLDLQGQQLVCKALMCTFQNILPTLCESYKLWESTAVMNNIIKFLAFGLNTIQIQFRLFKNYSNKNCLINFSIDFIYLFITITNIL